ncbi:phosphopantetheine-binding protein [Buchnera aphidicola (Mollitrichosiphum nigrofasciatum)]|uniref:acyl carrier protein n=1 Tax=Buchnera aphidicola TaxID=9 RepID=UPI0031B80E60
MKNIKKKIKKIFINVLNIKNEIHDTDDFKKLEIDSLDMIEIIMDIENKFDIEIKDETIEKLNNIKDLINYVKKNIKK